MRQTMRREVWRDAEMKARPLRTEEIARVRSYFDSGRHGRYAIRDRCIVELGLNAGLRVSELCALTVGQVWQHRRVVERLELTETKGGKHRAIPLNRTSQDAVRALIAWKAGRERLWPGDPLFRSMKGGQLTRQEVDHIWQRVRAACGIAGKVTTHTWRKTFATQLHALGVPLAVIKELLGHASIATTQAYLTVTAFQEAEAVSRLEELYDRSETSNFPELQPSSGEHEPASVGAAP